MIAYITGFILFFLMIIGMYLLGMAYLKENKSFSYNFIIGYLVYSFFVAIPGILVQVIGLEWIVFFISMIVVIISLTIFTIYRIKKYKIKVLSEKISDIITDHAFLVIICGILMLLFMCCYLALWYGNHLDDGFYLNKIATAPYVVNFSRITPSTGFYNSTSMNTYSFNTYEIEAAFYASLFNIPVTIYARFFLSCFNYFLLANVIYCLAKKIFDSLNIKYNKKIIQFVPAIIILFSFNEIFLKSKGIMWVQDSNQFTNAMYFGSSIVRTMGILFLIMPYLDKNDINLKVILEVIAISVVLISKSSIALPVIFVSAFSYLIATYLSKENKYKLISVILIGLTIGIGLLLKSNETVIRITGYSMSCFKNNANTILYPVALVLIGLSFFLKSKLINKLNIIIILITLLTAAPLMVNVTSKFGMFAFVMGRLNTVVVCTTYIIAYIYIYAILLKIGLKNIFIYLLSILSTLSLSFGTFYSIATAGGNLFMIKSGELTELDLYNSLKVMWHNKKLVPESAVRLGEVLNKLCDETNEDIVCLSRKSEVVDGTVYNLAVSLTQFSPKVKALSATYRYGSAPEGSGYENFNIEDQDVFENFVVDPSNNYYNFRKMMSNYSINCVILPSEGYDSYMKKLGYKLYDYAADQRSGVAYYVYYKGC